MAIGQCPSFTDGYVTWRRWVLLSIVLAATLSLMAVVIFLTTIQQRLASERLEKVRSEEKDRAHQLVCYCD